MKKVILLAAVICLSYWAEAQTGKRDQQTDSLKRIEANEQRRERVKVQIKELNLSKDQKRQLAEMKRTENANRASIEKDASLSDAQKRAKLKELRKQRQEKIQSMLTPEQKEKIKQQSTKANP
ncbi:MAG TPA: hypothetical protein PKK69_00810 [Ferruginibacter sp.]|nr:hypothetical protein [Ferruginibacter sp.]